MVRAQAGLLVGVSLLLAFSFLRLLVGPELLQQLQLSVVRVGAGVAPLRIFFSDRFIVGLEVGPEPLARLLVGFLNGFAADLEERTEIE